MKKFYKQEIKYAMEKICHHEIYKASEHECKMVEDLSLKKKNTLEIPKS